MKKIFSAFIIAVCCMFMAMPAQAQLIKWGVKGGVNLSKIDWKGGYDGNKDNSTGFFIGPMAEVTIPIVGLGVDAALMYSQRGNKYDVQKGNTTVGSIDAKQQGIEIPINLKYTFGLGSMLGIYVAAGPDFFFNFKDVDLSMLGLSGSSDNVDSKKAQVGLNLGAGVKLLSHLQIGFNYQIPLGNSFELKNLGDASAKTKTWQVSAAYIF
ncbi:porin family protein [Bacteroides helcogenes]|uniref:Transmembrane protein n=1 Tax=Bacteroides helcogenes (strain ATCC 35417 / DSM 20613 / JCM 6297 / CCUG 15421 / P 36-108) TaxID=693979 RepID=E6SR95_BACT6|nr:porin family protein [Bacteroides helcogenes]ADV43039.1 putative transmembrane protein [Bacteroides helcogenes P 36-108]MDY5236918.1 porin family protein [Bacteroides helcogenes]